MGKINTDFLVNFLTTVTGHNKKPQAEGKPNHLQMDLLNITVSILYNEFFGLAWLQYPRESSNPLLRHVMTELYQQLTESEDMVSVLLKEFF